MGLINLALSVGSSKTTKQQIVIPQKDFGYDVGFTVQYANAVAYNLSTYNVKFKSWSPTDPGTLLVSANCTAVNADAGTCNYAITSGAFNTVGIYYGELEMTNSNTIVESTETFKLIVTESG